MQLVLVPIPKSAKSVCGGLHVDLNRRERAVQGVLVSSDPSRYRGETIVCTAIVTEGRNFEGDKIPIVRLEPTKKRAATHATPYWDGSQIVIPVLQN